MEIRALVTGASRGIGAAIAKRLAVDGFSVIVNYRSDDDGAAAVVAEIEAAGGEASCARFDVSDSEATKAAMAGLLEDPRPIGVLVNNAGITRDAAFPMMNGDDWSAVISTTLHGFFHMTHPLVMPMAQRKWGRIINMSSISALRGYGANRFTDRAAAYGSLEYRLGVIPRGITFTDRIRIERINLALFYDFGTVAEDLEGLSHSRYLDSYGLGLHISFTREASFRIDYGFSDEGGNLTIGFGTSQ